jgi:hypothetical protein
MRYWSVFFIYVAFVFGISYYSIAQGCSTSEDSIMTGAACSIKDIKKEEKKDINKTKEKKIQKQKNIKKK